MLLMIVLCSFTIMDVFKNLHIRLDKKNYKTFIFVVENTRGVGVYALGFNNDT